MGLVKIELPLPAEHVVPHQGRLSLLRNVVAHSSSETVCDVLIGEDSLFHRAGGVGGWVALEYMAQTIAAHAGLVARGKGEQPRVGFLLGTRRMELSAPLFRVGETLLVRAQHLWGEGDLFSFHCSVTLEGSDQTLASADLNVFRPPHLEHFLLEE
jgi:predicted hotdog family 3-hydroxylacyl-ACP dehydratase